MNNWDESHRPRARLIEAGEPARRFNVGADNPGVGAPARPDLRLAPGLRGA